MEDSHWRDFFNAAADTLGAGSWQAETSPSWCSWTTFDRLKADGGYWTGGVPAAKDVFETYIGDSGVWGQPFRFSQLAHLVVLREFTWKREPGPNWAIGTKMQDIRFLSERLTALAVPHRLTDLVLEVKCY